MRCRVWRGALDAVLLSDIFLFFVVLKALQYIGFLICYLFKRSPLTAKRPKTCA